ncbi:MAG: PAS domain S-box protein, partial [Chloroflexota bacterium]
MSHGTTAFAWLDAISHPIFVLQAKRIVRANPAAAALTEYADDDLRGRLFNDLIAPGWHNGSFPSGKLQLITARGIPVWVEVALKDAEMDGELVTVATVSAVTDGERALETNDHRNAADESLFRRAVERSLDGFYLLEPERDQVGAVTDFRFAEVNAQGEAMVPYQREQMIGQSLCALFPIYRTARYIDQYIRVLDSDKALDTVLEFPQADGQSHWYHHQVIPLGERIAVFSRSITERKLTEAKLHDSENRYRALFNQANNFVTLIGLDGNYLLVNDKFATMLGYTPEEMIGKPVIEFMPAQEAQQSINRRVALLAGENIPLYVRVFRRKDGGEFLGEIDVTLVRDENGKALYVQSIIRDVTSRIQTEKALRESEERYRIISELISDYAYATSYDANGESVYEWNTGSFQRMTGYDRDELREEAPYTLFHPDDRERVHEDLQRMRQGKA